MSKKTALGAYFADWDPMGFIKQDGAPEGEYGIEAAEICLRFKPGMTDGDVAELVYGVFVEYIELDPRGFKEECFSRGADIKGILIGDSSHKKQ